MVSLKPSFACTDGRPWFLVLSTWSVPWSVVRPWSVVLVLRPRGAGRRTWDSGRTKDQEPRPKEHAALVDHLVRGATPVEAIGRTREVDHQHAILTGHTRWAAVDDHLVADLERVALH